MASGTRTFLLLLLASLMICKVSAFHICDHEHDQADKTEHCELCDLAIEIQQADAVQAFSDGTDLQEILPEKRLKALIRPDEFLYIQNLSFRLYGRPPPLQ
ncbi:hypothetical protein [Poritiphilus flavus]|uniref:Uncharacterized protein n=1 Tax=Poritiphilus flavus TaxID=2697053 RepID=A0A6L9EFY8_9FLAO|nr:hypothetical protein [Poritiphilus flavus]NAS13522.1 hypothetical protein [Poritiphilus flavus]